MKWPSVKISKVCRRGATRDPRRTPESPFKYIDISSVDREQKCIVSTPEIIGSEAPSRARKEVKAGDILVSTVRPNLNAVAIVPPKLDNQIASTGFCVLRPTSLIDKTYLFYFTISNPFIDVLTARVRGAHYPAVSDSDVNNVKIPLPPISEQRRIVEILDQADRLRKLRAEADKKAERILPALFIKMFGDPATNPMGWDTNDTFGDVGTLDRGKSRHRPRNAPELLGGDHPLIQTGDVANSGGRIRNHTQTYSDIGLAQSKMWPKGTLCITIAANIAKTGVLEFDACFPDSVVGFHPGPDVTTEYVQSWLYFLQPVLENNAPQAAQKNINLQVLRSLPLPKPPLPLQEKFSSMVVEYYKQIDNQLHQGERLETLFNSILHRAFTGDLTASWRHAHMEELVQEMELQAKALAA